MSLEKRIRRFEEEPRLRFSKVQYRSKRPIEKDWVNKPYTYQCIQSHIRHEKNYGVLCGRSGLVVADADNTELTQVIESSLPQTFTVETGGGGRHYYFWTDNIRKRIVLEKDGIHYGEIQTWGQQVVVPNSIHPNGNPYIVIKDLPIRQIGKESLYQALCPYLPKRKSHPNLNLPHFDYTELNRIPLTSVMDISKFRRAQNGELYGPNPWHGSTTGINTWINENKNVAYCFRHQSGIGVAKAIALNLGLISECGSALHSEFYKTIRQTAQNQHGLT